LIANCIETLRWCDQILVVDNGSSDATAGLAAKLGAQVMIVQSQDFAQIRNEGLKKAHADWVFYIDADERVMPNLQQEIQVHIETTQASALRMNRHNIMYGRHLSRGGWQYDYVTRVFRKKMLERWTGKVHESPIFKGELATIHSPLIHLTHRNTRDGLIKTTDWTAIEAELLLAAHAPRVSALTLIRKPALEFIRRYFLRAGYKDGMEGFVEALVQAMNKFLVYLQLWELQLKPSLNERYIQVEEKIAKAWDYL